MLIKIYIVIIFILNACSELLFFLCKTYLQQIENVTKPVLIVILQSLL